MMDIEFKRSVFELCEQRLLHKIKIQQDIIADLRESLNSETKSSSGDKRETGRAMVQLSIEQAGERLLAAEKALKSLKLLEPDNTGSSSIRPGSLVRTQLGIFYIATAEGQLEQGGIKVWCISPGSPLGQALLGKRVGDSCKVNASQHQIQALV